MIAARFALERVVPDDLPHAALLVPTRRATITLRDAFRRATAGTTLLLPRIFSLADVGDELLSLVGPSALEMLGAIPPAMPSLQQLTLLTAQVQAFEERRAGKQGQRIPLDHAMKLARNLMELQDNATRHHVALTTKAFSNFYGADVAQHWEQSLAFLNILALNWPAIEAASGMTTRAAREVAMLQLLEAHWRENPPSHPVIAVGSTASQPATATLLSTIAALEQGAVILPGIDPRCEEEVGEEGHPYQHMGALLSSNHVALSELPILGDGAQACSIWLRALEPKEAMPSWATRPLASKSWEHLTLIAAAQAEEEARVIALILREGLEQVGKRVALITPDEGLMARVDAQLKRFNLTANRLSHGSLAVSETGSAYIALIEAIAAPEMMRPLLNLLRHPLVRIGEMTEWQSWCSLFERAARGVSKHAVGQIPTPSAAIAEAPQTKLVQQLVRELADLSRLSLAPSAWVKRSRTALNGLIPTGGKGQEPVEQALDAIAETDENLPVIDADGFASLLREALAKKWRAPQFNAHPQLVMLTPVEARLQHFDRVVLGNMQETIWPGLTDQSPWLNRTQQKTLGLPGPEDHTALIAHDVLMLGSCGEVFLTYPCRDGGAPVTRSRFIERLVTLLATQGIPESALSGERYLTIARAWDAGGEYAPALPPRPTPNPRPTSMAVSKLDAMFSDPYTLYARYVLDLSKLNAVDAELEPRDFGTVAHAAIKALSDHWSVAGSAPDTATMSAIAEHALRHFSHRPNVQLFWKRRLERALLFVNQQEMQRRTGRITVDAERPIEQPLATLPLILKGKIDRLEQDGQGAVIADYKTGDAPTAKEVTEGKATQLLAYALLLIEQGQPIERLEYWELPRGRHEGTIVSLPWDDATADLLTALQGSLAQLLDSATPFLARPLVENERFDNDYDGISRYDEWAG